MSNEPSVFDPYNCTELHQACASAGINIKPDTEKADMIAYLEGWKEPPVCNEVDNVFHSWRHGLIGFLNEYWREIETQITCPARALKATVNPNPRPCFGSLDTQVVHCLIDNVKYVPLIESH